MAVDYAIKSRGGRIRLPVFDGERMQHLEQAVWDKTTRRVRPGKFIDEFANNWIVGIALIEDTTKTAQTGRYELKGNTAGTVEVEVLIEPVILRGGYDNRDENLKTVGTYYFSNIDPDTAGADNPEVITAFGRDAINLVNVPPPQAMDLQGKLADPPVLGVMTSLRDILLFTLWEGKLLAEAHKATWPE